MADVFLSYSSTDRAAAQRVQEALTARGIDLFWDQQTPPGQDWDTWIRSNLANCKVAIVLWSRDSVKSDNVRHEALVARKANKLIPAIIGPVSPEDLPMGLYMVQSVNLADWRSAESLGLSQLADEVEARVGIRTARPTVTSAAAPSLPGTLQNAEPIVAGPTARPAAISKAVPNAPRPAPNTGLTAGYNKTFAKYVKIALGIIAALAILMGGVWIFQGLNILPGSFMTGDINWTYRGAALAVAGAILLWSVAHRPKPKA